MLKAALAKGIVVTVVVLIICTFGLISLFRVPVQMTPDLTANSVSVLTFWPGATPQDIEKEIVIEQEKFLRSIPNLEKMTASATTGQAEIVLEFAVGTNLDEILVRVNNALTQVPNYPENVDQPRIVTSSASDQPIAWFSVRPLEGNPNGLDIVAQQDFLEDEAQTEFERTSGVSQSEIFGGAPRQMRIYVDPAKLAERGIPLSELRTALRARNQDVSGGDFDEGKRRYLIRTIGRLQDIEDVEATLIARRNNVPIYLRDVGYVELSRAQIFASVRHNGDLALAMNVRRSPGTNILQVMDSVKETVAELNEGLLKNSGMIVRQVSDDTIYIREAVALVRQNLLLGGFLATLILLLFLRSWKATLIGALAVPICTICSFLGLTIAGRTINVISLAGIAFAIGMTLDNSIVVLENIYRHRAMGKSSWDAARIGVTEVWGAVLASTLTTVMVFLPIIFIEEEAGQLFRDIAIAISSAIVFSMLVAVLVIPAASARLLHDVGEPPKSALQKAWQNLFGIVPLAGALKNTLLGVLNVILGSVIVRILLVVGMTSLSILIAIYLRPQREYLPEGTQNLVFAIVVPPPGYNIDEMVKVGKEIEAEYEPYIQVDPKRFKDGIDDVPAIQEFFFVSTNQNIFVVTKTVDPDDLDPFIGILTQRLNQIPGMFAFALRASIFSQGLSGTRGIDIDIQGNNLEDIFSTAQVAFFKIMSHEKLGGHPPEPNPRTLTLGQPLLEVRPDWERAAEVGVDPAELGYLVWSMADGAYVDEFFLGDDKIDMYLYSTGGTVQRTQDLENLPIYTRDGGTVPLGSIAAIRETANTETIRRVDRQRTFTLTVSPPLDLALEEAVEILETDIIASLIDEGIAPDGVTLSIAGASDKLKATFEALSGNFLLAVVISFFLMVALFSHWGYPFIIMMSLPLGIVGGIVGLAIINFFGVSQPLDVLTMLGFVVLLGTVVNNPILLVERSLQALRDGDAATPREAVMDATSTRFRPIMMSTMTTTFGLLPLVFLPGSGAELYRGLGTVVLFGLFFSTIFTLTFIPSLLSLFLEFGGFVKEKAAELSGERPAVSDSAIQAAGTNGSEQPGATSGIADSEPSETPKVDTPTASS